MTVEVKYVRDKIKESYNVKYVLSSADRPLLVSECGVNGLVVFEYYLRMAATEKVEITDENIAEYFGWNIHTAARHRRALIKKGWLFTESATTLSRNKVILIYLGKEEVRRAKQNQRKG